MVEAFRRSPKYRDLQPNTRKSYDAVLRLVSEYSLMDGRRFGAIGLRSITPAAADRLYEKLRKKADGSSGRGLRSSP